MPLMPANGGASHSACGSSYYFLLIIIYDIFKLMSELSLKYHNEIPSDFCNSRSMLPCSTTDSVHSSIKNLKRLGQRVTFSTFVHFKSMAISADKSEFQYPKRTFRSFSNNF